MPPGFPSDPVFLSSNQAAPANSRRDRLALGSLFDHKPVNLLKLAPVGIAPVVRRRSRIWELDSSFHCSIVGTCLSTADLRQALEKLGLANARSMSEHELHRHGVSVAGWRDGHAKPLTTAIDRRHERGVAQFAKAGTEIEVGKLWDEAVGRGEIPGAYCAALTHPDSGPALMKRAFGEVHMLSHLVGAANRADIRRLTALEAENAELRAKAERQQAQILAAITTRDAKIAALAADLGKAIVDRAAGSAPASDSAGIAMLVKGLEQRLATERAHGVRLAERLILTEERLRNEARASTATGSEIAALRAEIASLEMSLDSSVEPAAETGALTDTTLLYVGGRTGHVAGLRSIAARFSASLMHHDGGLESSTAQLAGLIARAEMVFFPVDCVSHDAMHLVKRLCRQAGKPYFPLRRASLATFLVALRNIPTDASTGQVAAAF